MLQLCLFVFFICTALSCPAIYKNDFEDADGNLLKFDVLSAYKTPYSLCCCNEYRYIFEEARDSLQETLKTLYLNYDFTPPFTWANDMKYTYVWDVSHHSYQDTFMYFCRYYFTRDPFKNDFFVENMKLYSEYADRYKYLDYWLKIVRDVKIKVTKGYIADKEDQIRKSKEENSRFDYLERDLKFHKKNLVEIPIRFTEAAEALSKDFANISDFFYEKYCRCLAKHKDPVSLYERGRIAMDRGLTVDFVDDLFSLIEIGYQPTEEMNLELGKSYNDSSQYHHAIKVLSEVLNKNPELKEAYFERAVAYFETGELQLALSDYLNFGKHPQLMKDPNAHYFLFSVGLGVGCAKGGLDSTIHFFPTLFSTIYGLGKGLWALVDDPIGVSKEIVDEAATSLDYLKNNLNAELLTTLVPELKDCLLQWDQLDEQKKGYYVGYVIGRYGVDAVICGGSLRAIQLYRNLKKANTLLNLETALVSSKNKETLARTSEEFFAWRNAYKQNCKLHLGQQEKHIPGANNFQAGKGELTISIEHLEEIVSSKIGEGVPSRFSFGEAGYKEVVDFDEIIGIHVDRQTKTRIPTSVGEIHYDSKGNYHVVPVEPNKIQRLLKGGE